ncbi:hypothetical protein [Levilactobacillus suantsaiihabitans]|uniref:Uncharacterized protein n=1 Tax=Levilactobacillus suantsaiihabitans TaxID=2487722 RepID=A0A4Z0J9J7_9LACO|nr:hypothetical protein [Levilactobacillus suantsaiihabitans]TGD18216.1 hypothetical protein EGT51_09265 [Levilactobacillus suantsaiihabitans]
MAYGTGFFVGLKGMGCGQWSRIFLAEQFNQKIFKPTKRCATGACEINLHYKWILDKNISCNLKIAVILFPYRIDTR